MKRFHLFFGLLLVVIFLLTGQYMDRFQHHLHGLPDGPRMLYRSRHIYILLSGLLHLGIGSYFKDRLQTARRILQVLGSLFVSVASIVFIVAFFKEPHFAGLYTPLSLFSVILIAVGTLFHLISGIKEPDGLEG